MVRKILKTVITIILILFPFWGSALISGFTPYNEGNSITDFILAYGLLTIVAAAILFYFTSRFKDAFVQPTLPGIILFFRHPNPSVISKRFRHQR